MRRTNRPRARPSCIRQHPVLPRILLDTMAGGTVITGTFRRSPGHTFTYTHNFTLLMSYSLPKLHNAMWPGLVGKGSPGAEPFIDLDTMLRYTAAAEVDGQKFDGVDLFLFDPHTNIDICEDDLKAMADKIAGHGLAVGSLVAPVWPGTVGFQADLAHTYLYLMGYNAPEAALLQEGYSPGEFHAAYTTMTEALRPWTIDFHVAQNDGTVHGSGSHDKTGRHCQADDPDGKLDITAASGYWLKGAQERGIKHLCWDGCMFPNEVLHRPATWNAILAAMLKVRDSHGWS